MLARVLGWMDGSYVDRSACDAALMRMHRRDAIGDRVHLWLACLGLVLIAGPTTVVELAFAPLLVFFVVRSFNLAPVWIHAFGQPSVLACGLLVAWLSVTLAWSPDPTQGLDELSRLRWFLLSPLLYPAMRSRGVLVHALAIGLILACVAQLASALPGIRELFPYRHPGRVTGWWAPVAGGSILCGAMGLFLAPAMVGAGRARVIGLVGLVLSSAGLLASGTRGAWIGAGLLLVIAIPLLLARRGGGTRRGMVLVLSMMTLGAVAGGVVFREGLQIRVDQAAEEIQAALRGEFASPTGARIAVLGLSLEEGIAHPLGHGLGSVPTLCAERFGTDEPLLILPHAHSTWAQLLVTGGVPAVLLGAALCMTLWRNAMRAAPREPNRALELGLPFALLGLMGASLFDVVLLNNPVVALLGAVAALSPAYLPSGTPQNAPG